MTAPRRLSLGRTEASGGEQCAVCAHGLAGHDPISARYCRATQANALSRNCICRPAQ